jgi:hypothetical protein
LFNYIPHINLLIIEDTFISTPPNCPQKGTPNNSQTFSTREPKKEANEGGGIITKSSHLITPYQTLEEKTQ